jgi:drug/metabolite transporter (DMT)-like permease
VIARRLPLLAALVTVCLWASAFIGIRYAGRELAPGPLALARLLIGSAALGTLMALRREPLVKRPGVRGTVVCGVLWFAAYNVALNAAERRVDAGISALLVNVAPVLIAVLAGLMLGEGFSGRLLGGCALAFSGVALIAAGTARHGVDAGLGTGLCLVAALLYACGVIAQKSALGQGSPLAVTWGACTVGAVCCLPYLPSLLGELGHVHAQAVLWAAYLGLVPMAIGFLTWAYALSRTDAGKLGSTTYLVPPIAVALGWVTLGEVPPIEALPGGILCLAGVWLARSTGSLRRVRGLASRAGLRRRGASPARRGGAQR